MKLKGNLCSVSFLNMGVRQIIQILSGIKRGSETLKIERNFDFLYPFYFEVEIKTVLADTNKPSSQGTLKSFEYFFASSL